MGVTASWLPSLAACAEDGHRAASGCAVPPAVAADGSRLLKGKHLAQRILGMLRGAPGPGSCVFHKAHRSRLVLGTCRWATFLPESCRLSALPARLWPTASTRASSSSSRRPTSGVCGGSSARPAPSCGGHRPGARRPHDIPFRGGGPPTGCPSRRARRASAACGPVDTHRGSRRHRGSKPSVASVLSDLAEAGVVERVSQGNAHRFRLARFDALAGEDGAGGGTSTGRGPAGAGRHEVTLWIGSPRGGDQVACPALDAGPAARPWDAAAGPRSGGGVGAADGLQLGVRRETRRTDSGFELRKRRRIGRSRNAGHSLSDLALRIPKTPASSKGRRGLVTMVGLLGCVQNYLGGGGR